MDNLFLSVITRYFTYSELLFSLICIAFFIHTNWFFQGSFSARLRSNALLYSISAHYYWLRSGLRRLLFQSFEGMRYAFFHSSIIKISSLIASHFDQLFEALSRFYRYYFPLNFYDNISAISPRFLFSSLLGISPQCVGGALRYVARYSLGLDSAAAASSLAPLSLRHHFTSLMQGLEVNDKLSYKTIGQSDPAFSLDNLYFLLFSILRDSREGSLILCHLILSVYRHVYEGVTHQYNFIKTFIESHWDKAILFFNKHIIKKINIYRLFFGVFITYGIYLPYVKVCNCIFNKGLGKTSHKIGFLFGSGSQRIQYSYLVTIILIKQDWLS